MVALATSVILILIVAWLVDLLLREDDVRKWQEASKSMRMKLAALSIDEATLTTNKWYMLLFDAVYGPEILSRKRVARSCVSSLLALLLTTLAIGWEDTIFIHVFTEYEGAYLNSIVVGAALFLLVGKFVADYFSLEETRLVMKFSQGSPFLGLMGWLIFDLAATAVVFVFFLLFFPLPLYLNDFTGLLRLVISNLTDKSSLLPFFLSTYFTSALWLLFLSSACTIRAVERLSPALSIVIRTIGESERPARAMAGFICAGLFVGFAGIYLVTSALTWLE